jgi:hypothetical protein
MIVSGAGPTRLTRSATVDEALNGSVERKQYESNVFHALTEQATLAARISER